ncbi:MAG: 4-(cytidine 5'-diphospho)-2-C-methyl-D-erythritol kinase [Pseudohongiellaceae bacterium]
MRSTLTTLSPAKLNLFLHITGRREDGYHNLQTVFQLLDYGDPMAFETPPASRSNGLLALHTKGIVMPVDDNLILRAARLLREEAAKPDASAVIRIHKRIPLGAGLGGGSSNAATTLLALNRLWRTGFSESRLCRLGRRLGADVPVFVRSRSAWAEGVGDELQPVELPESVYLVLNPSCGVSTAEVFSHEQLTRHSPAIRIADFLAGWGSRHCFGQTANDCEPVVRALYPEVDEALRCLGRFAEARMTGTGSGVFARFDDENAAQAVLAELPGSMHGFIARGVNRMNEVEISDSRE